MHDQGLLDDVRGLRPHGDVSVDAWGEVSVSKADFDYGGMHLAVRYFREDWDRLKDAGYSCEVVLQPEIGCPEYEIAVRRR